MTLRSPATTEPSATDPRVLLLSPAQPHPEAARHLTAVTAGLHSGGAEVSRIEPNEWGEWAGRMGTEFTARCRSLWSTVARTRRLGTVESIVVGRVDLVPAGIVAARITGARRVPVLFHGTDMWTMSPHLRFLLRRDPLLYPVTTSSFGAGALSTVRMGAILPPGLDHHWRETLLAEAARRRPLPPIPTVLSVFPLDEWDAKGLPALLEAVKTASRTLGPVRLVIAGPGPAPGALHAHIAAREHTELHEDPGDEALARLYATADLFALCTRTRTTAPASGEAHGTALIEAQLAGCAVIGPAQGGSRDAYQRGMTGWTPADESAPALAHILQDLLADRARLARAGRQASEWARAITDPGDHTRAVFAALLGREPDVSPVDGAPAQSIT